MEEEVLTHSSSILLQMILKKGSFLDPSNYRPIALVNTIIKSYTMIMHLRLNNWAEKNKNLPRSQAGFRSEQVVSRMPYSLTQDMLLILSHMQNYGQN